MTSEQKVICPKCHRMVPNRQMSREHVRPRFLDKQSGTNMICVNCNIEASVGAFYDSQSLATSLNKEPYKAFLSAMYEIDALLLMRVPDVRLSHSLMRILFASVVTSMETYLSDTFIPRVLNDEALVRRCVETVPRLMKEKRKQGTTFDAYTEVRDHLLGVTFHNLSIARALYSDVLNIAFPLDTAVLVQAVKTRHDIIHRSGKSKTGIEQLVSKPDLLNLVGAVKKFAQDIEEKLVGREQKT